MTTRIHPTLEDLVRLQFEARDFSLLPRQPVHSLLSGRHASRLRGRGLNFEEIRGYLVTNDRWRIGRFACSNPLLNKIYEADLRTYVREELADEFRVDIDRAVGELRMAFGHDAVML